MCRAIIGATPVYACPAGYSAQSAGCVSTATNGASLQAGSVRYFHTDHLGSVTAITDETGLVVERLAYDAWGKRRFTNGTADVNDTVVGLTTDRGYTEHEMLDELGIIHMNGRVYDPTIGRFMSADPYIQAPYELQSHNRYAYVMNNPLLYTDPSGYSWWTKLRGIIITVVAMIADAYGCAGYCSQAVQYYNAAKTAYNFAQTVQSQGWGAALKGAAISAAIDLVAQGAFGASGDVGGTGGDQYGLGHYIATAVAGCVSTVAGGGKCGQGAIAAVAGLAASQYTDGAGWDNSVYQHAASQVAGGLAAQAVGGSFANGAQTASYGYLYNHEEHKNGWGKQETLQDHVNRHGADFGITTSEQYALEAQRFREFGLNTQSVEFRIDKNGDYRIYDRATNTFGSYNADGTTKTFYKPTEGAPYWDKLDRNMRWGERIDRAPSNKLTVTGKILKSIRFGGRLFGDQ